MDLSKLQVWLDEQGESSFRLKQIYAWIFQKKAKSFAEMTNLSLSLRENLQSNFHFPSLTLVKKHEEGETVKYLWRLFDGCLVESVLIIAPHRRTVCVSSQVGCRLGCGFCASGKGGFKRDLLAFEIAQQVLLIDEDLTNIVFMGMGEPLLNYDNVIQAISLFSREIGISQRKISLSTAGIVENIDRLSEEKLQINLVISLHAASQKKREKLMPVAKKYNLLDLMAAAGRYFTKTGRDVAFEYVMLKDVNDSIEDAKELAGLLGRSHFSVNLIPYNPIDNSPYKTPETKQIDAFIDVLQKERVVVTRRYAKGRSISAACGQLALQNDLYTEMNSKLGFGQRES